MQRCITWDSESLRAKEDANYLWKTSQVYKATVVANNVDVEQCAYAGGKNEAHKITLAAPHSTTQTIYALPHRGRSTSRVAAAQYVLGSDGSNRSAICVCAFVSRVMPSTMACTACAVVVNGLKSLDFLCRSKDMWDTL